MVALSVEELGVEHVTDWLYRISAPAVNVYAIRQSGDIILVDAGLVGYERAYLGALAQITGAAEDVRVSQIFLTHGHDDHTGSAAALAAITGAAIVGPALDQAVIEGRARRAEPHPPLLRIANRFYQPIRGSGHEDARILRLRARLPSGD